MECVIPNGTEILLRDLVHDRTGLLFDHDKTSVLLDKLSPLVIEHGFQSFLDYYYLLKYDQAAEEEWRRVIDAISVQETFFWREMDQVHALVDVLVPEWAARRCGQPLQIWSAACATGEEPLTIAMALNEAGWFDRIPIEITGTDGSPVAIERARRGLFRERAFRNLPLKLRNKYFEKSGDLWEIDPRLHARISWDVANLVNRSEIVDFARVPFIFCRNVFIYFSYDMIRRVVGTFASQIQGPAYLFVGLSESLLKISNDFELISVGDAFVYKLSASQEMPFSLKQFNSATMK